MSDTEVKKMLKSHSNTIHTWAEKISDLKEPALIYICSADNLLSCTVAGSTPAVYTCILEILERTAKLSNVSFNDLMAVLIATHFGVEAAPKEKKT